MTKQIKTYGFIDASNIIYGTRDEGWRVDFQKLFKYLTERYSCRCIYYFGGSEKQKLKQQAFYRKLKQFGYILVLKPVKIYHQHGGSAVRKANCDVDLTFYAMRDYSEFQRGIFLTGDGDFEILFKYLLQKGKDIQIIASGKRTAKELRLLVREKFTEIGSLKQIISYKKR